GDHGLADTVSHQGRVAGCGFRDALEGDDHTHHRTDQTEQRTGRHGEAQEGLKRIKLRNSTRYGFRNPQFSHVRIFFDMLILATEGKQHSAKRIIRRGSVKILELTGHSNADHDQPDELEYEHHDADEAYKNDDIADGFTNLDTLQPGGTLNVKVDEHATGLIDHRFSIAVSGFFKFVQDAHELAGKLPRQKGELLQRGQVLQEFPVRRRRER